MKAIIAIDSFKGCLTSIEAEQCAAQGLHAAFPDCEISCIPVADGGEGMLEILLNTANGKRIIVEAHDPLMEIQQTHYGISVDKHTAFIEMANISGLPLVPVEKRNPLLTTTFGTGELIKDALERGCRNFVIGIGGSATNDAGLGMLQALGFRFLDSQGKELGTGGQILSKVNTIEKCSVHPALKDSHFTIACDVDNPFFGPSGAAYIFAPQKGADKEMVEILDNGLQNLAKVIFEQTGKDITLYPGAGAAGGMGGSMLALLNAELKSGTQLLLDALQFSEQIKGADFIITGEGKSDRQTIMGKVPYGVLLEANKQQIPVILIAGSIEDVDELKQAGFQAIFSITPAPIPLEQAMQANYARKNIQYTVEQIGNIMKMFSI